MRITMKNSGIEWVGEIPAHWIKSKIKYRFKVINGATPSGSDQNLWDGDIAWITPADMPSFGYVDSGKRYITLRGYNSCGTSIVPAGSIIISSRAPIGKVCLSTKALCTNQGCKSLVCYQDNRFYFYFMMAAQEEMVLLGRGTTFMELSTTALENMGIVLPLLSEQKAIAGFLDEKCKEVDALIGEIGEEIETLEQYKRSVITEAVTKGLDPSAPMKESGIDWLDEIPMLWETKRIAAFYQLRNEKVSDKDFPPLSVTKQGVLPQLETVAKTDDGDNRKLVRKGDFAINSRSDRRGSCGISNYDGSVSLINIVLKPRDKANNKYYNWLFHTEQFADEFYKWGNGIVDDLWTTRWQNMKKIIIPVPPMEEQQQIADYLDKKCNEIEEIITDKQSQIETLEAYKKSLIYEYVTGKKGVG